MYFFPSGSSLSENPALERRNIPSSPLVPPVGQPLTFSKRELRMHSRTLTQFTSVPDTVTQIRLEVHERRPTVHLDKVPLLMARGSPGDRPLTGGSIREGRAEVEMGRHCQSLGANDGVRGAKTLARALAYLRAVTCSHAARKVGSGFSSTGLSDY